MALRLFKNLIITFICSSALVTAGILSMYYVLTATVSTSMVV